MTRFRIVPDRDPNANSSLLITKDPIDTSGTWADVCARLQPYMPVGWHLVKIGD